MGKISRTKPAGHPAGFTPAEIAAANAASHAAASGRNPRKVREAFFPPPLRVGAVEILPFTTGRYLLLEQLGSPFVTATATAPTSLDVLEAVFTLSQPPEAILDVLARGREAFRREVMLFADAIPVGDLPALGAAINTQLARAQSTIIGSPASSGEDAGAGAAEKKSSPAPVISPASPPSRTDSAGP